MSINFSGGKLVCAFKIRLIMDQIIIERFSCSKLNISLIFLALSVDFMSVDDSFLRLLKSGWCHRMNTMHQNCWRQIGCQFSQQVEIVSTGRLPIRWINSRWWWQIQERDSRLIRTLLNDSIYSVQMKKWNK